VPAAPPICGASDIGADEGRPLLLAPHAAKITELRHAQMMAVEIRIRS